MLNSLEWMAWTTPTAVFFTAVLLMLITMTVISVRSPSSKRKGFLPIATTRGDRLYIGLIVTAFINLAYLGFSDSTMWVSSFLSLLWLFSVMRWG